MKFDCFKVERSKEKVGLATVANPPTLEPAASVAKEVCLLRESPLRILRVAENGNVREFQRILRRDASRLEAHDSRGRAAVHQAAMKNHVGILEIIVKFKGSLNVQDTEGNTPLHVAVDTEAEEAIDFLLSQNVSGKLLNRKSQTALHLAAESNRVRSMKILAKYVDALDVSQPGDQGRTPLHLACIQDNDECVRILLEDLKASPKKACSNSFLPIHEAAKHASSKSLEVLLDFTAKCGCSLEEMMNFPDAEGNLPLHAAIHGGDCRTVELCLLSGSKISVQQHHLSTAVHLACSQGALDLIKLMFQLQPEEKESSLNSCDLERMTPLHYAAMYDHRDVVEYLVSEGACLDLLDKNRCSPLHLSASRNAWQTVKTIVRLGGDTKLQDKDGRTVLHTVVRSHGDLNRILDEELAMYFIPILEIQDKHGNTALHLAAKLEEIHSVSKLLTLGASITRKNYEGENVFHIACRYGRLKVIKQIILLTQFSAVINESNAQGSTPFHIAAREGHTKVLQVLMKKGAFLHRDQEGRTSLHLAAENGRKDVMTLLLSTHSHLIDLTDKLGNTALHRAAIKNQPKAVELLLRLNCQLTYNHHGYSAIDYALVNKSIEVAYVMVTHKSRGDEVLGMNNGKHSCIMETLIAKMPGVAKSVLDNGIKTSLDKPDSPLYCVEYDFRWLTKPSCNKENGWKSKYSAEQVYLPILNQMVAHGRVNLLSHELSIKYLQMKWDAYGKYFQFINLFCYLVYLALLTFAATAGYSKDNNFYLRWKDFYMAANATYSTEEHCYEVAMEWAKEDNSSQFHLDYHYCKYIEYVYGRFDMWLDKTILYVYCVVVFITLVNILMECASVYRHGTTYYQNFDVWVWIAMNVVCFMAAGEHVLRILFAQEASVAEVYNPGVAIASFLGWFYLLLIFQRFDAVGLYVSMFLEILKTLVRVLLIFSVLIIAFAITFYILLSNGNHIVFSNFPMAAIRTFSMMLGDLDFMNTFAYPTHCERMEKGNLTNVKGYSVLTECKYPRRVPHPHATFPMVCLYMVFMPIVMINLLIGLAVGDIESVRKNAQLKRLTMQVHSHTNLEKSLPKFFIQKVDRSSVVVYPNEKKKKLHLFKQIASLFQQSRANRDETEVVDIESDDLMDAILDNSSNLIHITNEIESMKNMIQLLCQKLNVTSNDVCQSEVVMADELSQLPELGRGPTRKTTVRARRTPKIQFSESEDSSVI